MKSNACRPQKERARARAPCVHEENERALFPSIERASSSPSMHRLSLSLSLLAHAAAWDDSRGLQLQFEGYLRVVISLELAEKSAKE